MINEDSVEYKGRKYQYEDKAASEKKVKVAEYDATVHYKDGKPCAVVLSGSDSEQGKNFHEVRDELMNKTANGVVAAHNKNNSDTPMVGTNKLYVFARNENETFKQQPYELHVTGSEHDQLAKEYKMIPYSEKNNSSDHRPLDSIHKDKMEFTISDLKGRGLSDYNMPSSGGRISQDNSQTIKR